MKHICRFCGKTFETGTSLGAHTLSCIYNPNKDNMEKKRRETRFRNINMIERTLNCECCGKEFTLTCSDNEFHNNKRKKCCSASCSHKLAVLKCDTESKNKKIREYWSNKNITYKKYTCEYCGKEFTRKEHRGKYCSDECSSMSRSKKLSESAIKRKLGGLNPLTTYKSFKQGIYKGIKCDSSWELAFVIYCIDNNIKIERYDKSLQYTFNGKICNFYPDFLVENELVEIKGFWTKRNIAKREQCKNVKFIDKFSIKKYIDYVELKYGKDFIKMYNADVV